MAPPSFPFPSLPAGDVLLPPAGPEALSRDVQIIRWFIVDRWGRQIKEASPLGEALALAQSADLTVDSPPVESLEPPMAKHHLHAFMQFRRLAWAITALHGNPAVDCEIDGSFIEDELMGTDNREREATQKLPAGVGTIYFAGRLVQAGGGGRIRISGHGVPGHDIRYANPNGDVLLIERKDRSYQAGLDDSPEKRIARVITEINTSGRRISQEAGAIRILMIGFQHLVDPKEVNELNAKYVEAVLEQFGVDTSPEFPDCVIVEHLGLEPKTGGLKTDFWCPMFLADREEVARVAPMIWKAIGGTH